MNYSIHFSPTGGTQKVAAILASAMGGHWQEIGLCREVAPMALTAGDVCLVSVPSYGGRVPTVAIQRLKAITGNGAKAVLNCVYGNREWEDTLTELQDALEEQGFICAAAVAAVVEHSIFRQFAAGRPDANDAAQLTGFAAKIREKLNGGVFGDLNLSGSHGTYREFGGTPFKPEGNENCSSCGLCAQSCPVGAIDVTDSQKTDKDKCISCMRCIQLCPNHARDLDAAFMAQMSEKMAPKLSGHKENHLFL